MIFCKYCGKEVEQNEKFCSSCGQSQEESVEFSADKEEYCTDCGTIITKDDGFCPSCGVKLFKKTESSLLKKGVPSLKLNIPNRTVLILAASFLFLALITVALSGNFSGKSDEEKIVAVIDGFVMSLTDLDFKKAQTFFVDRKRVSDDIIESRNYSWDKLSAAADVLTLLTGEKIDFKKLGESILGFFSYDGVQEVVIDGNRATAVVCFSALNRKQLVKFYLEKERGEWKIYNDMIMR